MLSDDIHSLTSMKTGFLQGKKSNPLESSLGEKVAEFVITDSFVKIKNTHVQSACTHHAWNGQGEERTEAATLKKKQKSLQVI